MDGGESVKEVDKGKIETATKADIRSPFILTSLSQILHWFVLLPIASQIYDY